MHKFLNNYNENDQIKRLVNIIIYMLNLRINNSDKNPYSQNQGIDDTKLLEIIYTNINIFNNPIIESRILDFLWCFKTFKDENIKIVNQCISKYKECLDLFMQQKILNIRNLSSVYFIFNRYQALSLSLNNPDISSNFYSCIKSYLLSDINENNWSFIINYCYKTIGETEITPTEKTTLFNKLSNFCTTDFFKNASCDEKYKIYRILLMFLEISNKDKILDLQNKRGEVFIEEAEKHKESFIKIEFIKKAIAHYYKTDLPNREHIINKLKLDLTRLQSAIKFDMNPVVFPPDCLDEYDSISKSIAINHIRGKNFKEALIGLSVNIVGNLCEKPQIEKISKNSAEQSLMSVFSNNIRTDSIGRTISYNETPIESATRFNHSIILSLVCSSARHSLYILNEEHSYTEQDIFNLVKLSIFIPHHISYTITKGLYYFLQNKHIEATYLIVPNIEECLRLILNINGIATNYVKNEKIDQDKIDLKYLLNTCLENKILDETLHYYLNIILIDPIINLRNNTCHGILPYYAPSLQYINILCGILLHCIFYDQIQQNYKEKK